MKLQNKLKNVWIIGDSSKEMAEKISDDITVIPLSDAKTISEKILSGKPQAVLWGSDMISKRISSEVAATLLLGLCADCTDLETDGNTLYMYRPAFFGNIIAKIKCITTPQMATVRCKEDEGSHISLGIGFGAKEALESLTHFAYYINANVTASRKAVERDMMPYSSQVGLTGKTTAPDVYIAVGISGAIHHIAGMKNSGTVIAVNPDINADIFKYADFGIACTAEEFLKANVGIKL